MNDTRLPLLVGLLVLTVIGIVIAVVSLPDSREEPPRQPVTATAPEPKEPALPQPSLGKPETGFTEPELEVQPVPEAPVIVDSFPPTRQAALADWKRTGTVAGYFDGIALLAGDARTPLDVTTTPDINSRLVASGWAGDPHLGLPLHDVLLSQCGRIVARARVTLERADVADAVHPNLGRSGWEAVIHASDLAICGDATMRVWAILPGKPAALLPLNGTHLVEASPPAGEAEYHVPALPPVLPADVEAPLVTAIDVTASRVNLRRCNGSDCPRVSQVEGGRHRVHVASRRDGWTLLIFKDRAGWMSDTLFKPVP